MGTRRKIGLIFSNNENWIGGTYYILNLVHALNTLSDEEKPQLIVFTSTLEERQLMQNTDYPYIQFLPVIPHYNFLEKCVNKCIRIFKGKNIIDKSYSSTVAEVIFPYYPAEALFNIPKKLFWIPDLQVHFLPNFYTQEELHRVTSVHQDLVHKNETIIFSSKDAKRSFDTVYKGHNCKTFEVNFAVTHPDFQNTDIELLKSKYALHSKYFISPNQFWKHKNHQTVLDAALLLKQKGLHFQIIFTGKEYDNRNPGYTEELKQFVVDNALNENVKFLGFIDRKEQLQLMKNAQAVIQPSLFEGWSTVVEDAKSMNQYLILSDLNVHHEQIKKNCAFFSPYDAATLAKLIENKIQKPEFIEYINYNSNIRKFALKFLEATLH